MAKKPQEDRLCERLDLPIKVDYEVSSRPHELKGAISKNISGGGICLSLFEKLLPGSKLKIKIKLPKADPIQHPKLPAGKSRKAKLEQYELVARVSWIRAVEVSGQGAYSSYYDTGIQFLEADPVVIGKIVSYFRGREL